MTHWLLFLSTILTPGGQIQGAAVDTPPGNPCQVMDVTPEPAVCVSTPHRILTVNRADGHTDIYVSVRASHALTSTVAVTISISPPGNSSGVQLRGDNRGLSIKLKVAPGEEVKDAPLLLVQTEKNNHQSGRLSYTIAARMTSSSEASVKVMGAPLMVDVQTTP